MSIFERDYANTSNTSNVRQIYTSSGPSWIVRSEELGPAGDRAMNSRLLVRWQKMHESQKCYAELTELTVGDIWQIADADQELRRLVHSS